MHFPRYPKPHKSGQARIRLGGKDVYLGVHGSPASWARYRQLLAEWEAAGGQHVPAADPATLTVAGVVARFIEYAAGRYDAAGELANYRHSLKPLVDLYGPEPAASFGPKKLKALQRYMVKLGWCRNTVNRRASRVRTCWRWAESEELLPAGATHALDTVAGLEATDRTVRHTKRRRGSTRAELDQVLPHCPKPVAAMLDLQWWAGMRSQEVRLMRAADIDRSRDVWIYRPSKDKTAHLKGGGEDPRLVPLGPECQRILAPWLNDADPAAYLFKPCNRGRKDVGEYYAKTSYCRAVRRACLKSTHNLGLTVRERAARTVFVQPYMGRHAAKARITREMGLDAARAVLGQRSLGTTAGYSAQIDLEHATAAARKLG